MEWKLEWRKEKKKQKQKRKNVKKFVFKIYYNQWKPKRGDKDEERKRKEEKERREEKRREKKRKEKEEQMERKRSSPSCEGRVECGYQWEEIFALNENHVTLPHDHVTFSRFIFSSNPSGSLPYINKSYVIS